MLMCPALLLLPLPAMMRDSRGPTCSTPGASRPPRSWSWSRRLDGGAVSPLDALLFLTLGYLAVAYSPYGVVAMGTLMSGSYLVFVELPAPSMSGMFFLAVMLSFTMICAMNSANSWAAYDEQDADPGAGDPGRDRLPDRHPEPPGLPRPGRQRRERCRVGSPDGGLPRRPRRVQVRQRRRRSAAGDAALQAIAAALGSAVRETDTVARLGGDEFAVLPTSPSASPARCWPSGS